MLGFGSASLFQLPRRRHRRRLLELAYDAGVRHFDVAPMYGLGRAELELSDFLAARRGDVTVATKFGVRPTLLGRAAGMAQPPVRAALRRLPEVQARLQSSGAGPGSGRAGRSLYRDVGHSRASAQASLTRSLHALRTDHIDLFLLHEPAADFSDADELSGYLEDERQRGRIRAWGTAGDLTAAGPATLAALPHLQVVQRRDNLLNDDAAQQVDSGRGQVTFGILAQVLAPLRRLLTAEPERRRTWNEMSGCDLGVDDELVGLLLREAVTRNQQGPVLFTTTRADRLALAVQAVERQQPAAEALVVGELRAALRHAAPGSAL